MKKKVNFYLDEEIVNSLKHLAVDNGTNMSEIIRESIRQYIKNIRNRKKEICKHSQVKMCDDGYQCKNCGEVLYSLPDSQLLER